MRPRLTRIPTDLRWNELARRPLRLAAMVFASLIFIAGFPLPAWGLLGNAEPALPTATISRSIHTTSSTSPRLPHSTVSHRLDLELSQSVQESSERSVGEIRRLARSRLSRLKQAGDSASRRGCVWDILSLLAEIRVHSQFVRQGQLDNIRAQLIHGLKNHVDALALADKRRRRTAANSAQRTPESSLTNSANSRQRDTRTEASPELLRQWTWFQERHAAAFFGGPLTSFGKMTGNYAPPFSDQELIDLIQATIQPGSWSSQGGEGEIVYYQPALALVVWAAPATQDELYDLLLLLR